MSDSNVRLTASREVGERDHARASHRIVAISTGLILLAAVAYATQVYSLKMTIGASLVIAACVAAAYWLPISERVRSTSLSVLGMLAVGLLIHAARGRPEAHFSVFVFLAILLVYRDWIAILVGAGTVAVHHLAFNFLQQWGWDVVCFVKPGLGLVVEHAAYVVVEAAVLVVMAVRAQREMASIVALHTTANDALARLQSTIRMLEDSAASVSGTSDQIAANSRDLSSRTDNAKQAIEEAGSNMTRLSDALMQTTLSVAQVTDRATEARDVAEQAGAVVNDAVQAMGGISGTSRRIGDIVGVIDGIAFQTNLLALNAAVEAARAGEQGRGFAVVAQEVRGLARRSAEAAKEIKTLVTGSIAQVEHGVGLVRAAGDTMKGIEGHARQVATLIADIATASRDQTDGIRQVTVAVSQLRNMTADDARLVRDGAESADRLRSEATHLLEAVRGMRLEAPR